jgi:uroporphyrinogen decarboxylase
MSTTEKEKTKQNIVLDAIDHNDMGCIPYWIEFGTAIGRKMARYYGVDSIDEYVNNAIEVINMVALPNTPRINKPSLKGYSFPQDPSPEMSDRMKAQAGRRINKYRIVDLGGLWIQAASLRGMKNLMNDLIYQPNFVHELLDGILDVFLANVAICHNGMDIDCIILSDGFGHHYNKSLSDDTWLEFMRPRLQRLSDTVHAFDLHFALSASGAIDLNIADIVAMGVDILKPEHSECIDILEVKREFGRYITLWGGYGTHGTLLFSTPEHVRDEINELCENLGKGGGFIFSPDEKIQNDVPIENAAALIEVAFEREKGRR